jgi:hypothetical protein
MAATPGPDFLPHPADGQGRAAWPPLAATAVGSLPGTSSRDAAALVLGELEVPVLPELPARGPGADVVGRTMALVAAVSSDLAVATTPTGWRLAGAAGRDTRRAASWLGEDLDAFEEAATDFVGALVLPLCGPWTLAAMVELPSGERVASDPGAARDLAEALAEAVAGHVRDVRKRVPGAAVCLRLDEPALPGVLRGSLPTQSGWGRVRAVEPGPASAALAAVLARAAAEGALPAVHCCAPRPPYALLREAGARSISVDLLLHADADDDATGECLDAGVALVWGVVPAGAAGPPPPGAPADAAVAAVERWRHRLGLDLGACAPLLAVSPTCGLAGASPAGARAALDAVRETARRLREEAPAHG